MTATADDVIESIRAAERDRRRAADDAYRAVVAKLADGQAVDPADAEDAMEAAGKGAADLAADVSERRRRVDLARQADRRGEYESAVAAADRRIAELSAEADAFVAAIRAKIDPLVAERQAALFGLQRAGEAAAELRQSYRGPARDEAARVARELERLRQVQVEENRLLCEAEQLAALVTANPERWPAGEGGRIAERVNRRKAALADARRQSAALLARSERIQVEMSQP